jgi:carbonic anhydrase/acetyltransferase-like protein (isoleucine patch superfamily)
MIITSSNKPIRIIGFAESTITQEGVYFISSEYEGTIDVITPDDFLASTDKHEYQYLVFFTLDAKKRIEVIDIVESLQLDCLSFVHDSAVIYKDLRKLDPWEIALVIGRGTVICPFSSIMLHSTIGNHCLIELYCLISHYCKLGNNVILHSGTTIAGRTIVGDNCVFNFKSTVLNALTICDNVEVGALSGITKNITQPGRYIGTIARYAGPCASFDE